MQVPEKERKLCYPNNLTTGIWTQIQKDISTFHGT